MLAQVWTLSHTDLSTRADCCADSAWLIAQANAATDMLNHERTHSSRYRSSHSQTPHPVGQAISRLRHQAQRPVSLSKRLAPQASGWPTRLPADTWAISRLLTQQPSPQVSYLSTQALQVPAPCTDSSRRALP